MSVDDEKTLQDEFAQIALNRLLAEHTPSERFTPEGAAKLAYEYATECMRERSKAMLEFYYLPPCDESDESEDSEAEVEAPVIGD